MDAGEALFALPPVSSCGGVQAESEAAERPRFLVFGLPQGGDAGLAGEAPGRVQRAAAGATVKAHVR